MSLKTFLNKNKETTLPTTHFWITKSNYRLEKSDWYRAIETTKKTRLRVLHWKILYNIYPTNIMLHKMKINEMYKCSYCSGEVDFIEHFVFACPLVKICWTFLEQYIYMESNIKT